MHSAPVSLFLLHLLQIRETITLLEVFSVSEFFTAVGASIQSMPTYMQLQVMRLKDFIKHSHFQLSVESNQAIALVLVLLWLKIG